MTGKLGHSYGQGRPKDNRGETEAEVSAASLERVYWGDYFATLKIMIKVNGNIHIDFNSLLDKAPILPKEPVLTICIVSLYTLKYIKGSLLL